MAARRVTALVCILALPSRHEGDWRAALRGLAARAQWDYRDYWGMDDQPIDRQRPTLVVTMDESTLGDVVPTDWVVLTAPPEEVVAVSQDRFNLEEIAALEHAASRLTAASSLIGRGALQYRSADTAIDIPGLGPVERPGSPAPAVKLPVVSDDLRSTLQIFNTLPPPVGASALWPASIFRRFDDETRGAAASEIDLTGRGRILIHGPYLAIPAGRWKVTFDFEFETPVGSAPFRFEWGQIADVVVHDARAAMSGRYSISLEHDWAEAGRAEVRIWLYHAVFQGSFRLLGCTVARVPAAEPSPTSS